MVFWDQCCISTFDPLDDVCTVDSSHVYIGGFHVNGSRFCSLGSHVSDQMTDGGCDFVEDNETLSDASPTS